MQCLDLNGILSPFSSDTFFAEHFGKAFLRVQGPRGKFGSLLSWSSLNNILNYHSLQSPQLRIAKSGKILFAEELYTGRNSGISTSELTKHLRDGATLVVEKIDEMHEPVGRLAERLERSFQTKVQVNLYAGWRTTNGFDLHWDNHDVLIAQVAGRKQWKVYGDTKKYPLGYFNPVVETQPSGSPVWEDELSDGDLLYIPRGWWHVAVPCDEPTLHLTIGIHNPTALDLLRWLTARLSNVDYFRMDLPAMGDDSAQAAYLSRIQNKVTEMLSDTAIIKEFLSDSNAQAKPRTKFGFPWSAMPARLPEDPECFVEFVPVRNLELRPAGPDAIEVLFAGRAYAFDESASALFQYLAREPAVKLKTFYDRFKADFNQEQLAEFLSDLSEHGIVTFHEPTTNSLISTAQEA
jgi:hypothetical protein